MTSQADKDFELCVNHPMWDESIHRIRLDAWALEKLPVRYISLETLCERMTHLQFNPPFFYPPGIALFPKEAGHDLLARYVVTDDDARHEVLP